MKKSRNLSKSKIVAYRQCPKRLWLEVHKPHLRADDPATEAVFRTGHEVGELAQQIYDPDGEGDVVDFKAEGFNNALRRTKTLLDGEGPVFEAGLKADGAFAFADIMMRVAGNDGGRGWRMVEVKSSTSVKDYQREDVAIQSFAARRASINLKGVAIAHIDNTWVYAGDGNYRGLLVEEDQTEAAFARSNDVETWVRDALEVANSPEVPAIDMGPQCKDPFLCGFAEHCASNLPNVDYPVDWLPGRKSAELEAHISSRSIRDLRDLPEQMLNEVQRRVVEASTSGAPYFDQEGASAALAPHAPPAYFIDFETIQFGIPRWAGTRPYQMLPFQFSSHHLDANGQLTHDGHLDLSGEDPTREFARRLIEVCDQPLPIFVYNKGFEGARIAELADRYPEYAAPLTDIRDRLVDLLPITRKHYYHPDQQGSWSIKNVLPTIAPDLDFSALPGVRDGVQAMEAYIEAIDPTTSPVRKREIQYALEQYCARDTEAIVALWQFLTGSQLGAQAI